MLLSAVVVCSHLLPSLRACHFFLSILTSPSLSSRVVVSHAEIRCSQSASPGPAIPRVPPESQKNWYVITTHTLTTSNFSCLASCKIGRHWLLWWLIVTASVTEYVGCFHCCCLLYCVSPACDGRSSSLCAPARKVHTHTCHVVSLPLAPLLPFVLVCSRVSFDAHHVALNPPYRIVLLFLLRPDPHILTS